MGHWGPLFEAGCLNNSHDLRRERVGGAPDSQRSVPKPPGKLTHAPCALGSRQHVLLHLTALPGSGCTHIGEDISSERNTHGPDGSPGFQRCSSLSEKCSLALPTVLTRLLRRTSSQVGTESDECSQ